MRWKHHERVDSVDMSFSWISHEFTAQYVSIIEITAAAPIWPWPGEGAPFVGVFCHSGPQLRSWVAEECWHFRPENSMNSAEQCENPAEQLCQRLFVRVLAWIELWSTWKIPKVRMWQVAGSKMVQDGARCLCFRFPFFSKLWWPWSELFGASRPCAWIGRRCVGPARTGEAISNRIRWRCWNFMFMDVYGVYGRNIRIQHHKKHHWNSCGNARCSVHHLRWSNATVGHWLEPQIVDRDRLWGLIDTRIDNV